MMLMLVIRSNKICTNKNRHIYQNGYPILRFIRWWFLKFRYLCIPVLIIWFIFFVSANNKALASTAAPRFLSRGHTYRAVVGDTLVLPCEVENLGKWIMDPYNVKYTQLPYFIKVKYHHKEKVNSVYIFRLLYGVHLLGKHCKCFCTVDMALVYGRFNIIYNTCNSSIPISS